MPTIAYKPRPSCPIPHEIELRSRPVLTFGPGQLVYAHSDREQIALDELRAAAEFLAVFLLRQTGTWT